MARNTNVYSTTFVKDKGWYGSRRCSVIRGNLAVTEGSTYAKLPLNLPGWCRVIAARLTNQTTVPVTGGVGGGTAATSGTAPTNYALVAYPSTNAAAITAPPSTVSQSFQNGVTQTNGLLIQVGPGTASAATTRGGPECERVASKFGTNAGLCQNTNSSEAFMCLVPTLGTSYIVQNAGTVATATNTGVGIFGSQTATSTNSYTVQVEIFVEEYTEG